MTNKTANVFASVMDLGYNENVLYPRPITLARDICGFIDIMGLTCLIKLVRFIIFILNIFTCICT